MGENNVMLEVENVSFSYPNHGKVLDGLHFKLCKGDKVGLIGHNGSGKSTFLHIIMGLLRPDFGIIRLFGKPVETESDFREVRKNMGFLFQNADDQLFSPTVLEDVAFGPLNMGKTTEEAMEMSLKTLRDLNLNGFEDRITYKMSGGEKKLVSLATVLVMKPRILLLDEPTTGLDPNTRERIIDILKNLSVSYLIVSHEYNFLAQTTDHIYCMECGTICDRSSIHNHFNKTATIVYNHA